VVTHWAAWTVIMFLPFLNNAADRQIVGPSRQLYLASAGASVLLGWGIYYAIQRVPGQWARKTAFVLTCLTLAYASAGSYRKAEAIDYWLVGRSYVASQQIEEGLALFAKAYEHGPDILPVRFYTQSAIVGFGYGIHGGDQLQYARTLYPEDEQIALLIRVVQFMSDSPGMRQRGKEQIEALIQASNAKESLEEDLTAALQNSAGYLHRNGSYDEAIELYRSVLDMRPNYLIAQINMGRAFFAKNMHEEGVQTLVHATAIAPGSETAWKTLGDMYWEMGDYDKAETSYHEVISINPINGPALQNLAGIYFDRGEFQEALSLYQLLVSREANQSNLYNLGVVYQQMGDFGPAETAFERAREIGSENAEILMRLAEVCYSGRNFSRAIQIYQEIIKADSTNAIAYSNLGALWIQEKHPNEAVRVFEKAARMLPADQDLKLGLAYAYESAGRGKDALSIYHRILETDPGNQVAQQRINLNL
jgi:tetratricopeptide (TPR) repeat protein